MPHYNYQLFVIGGGSGGVRAARIAASLGARVAIAESFRYGGTCVIRGCVPKKLLVYAAHFAEDFADAQGFGWTVPPAEFSWPQLIEAKNREIARLSSLLGGHRNIVRAMPNTPALIGLGMTGLYAPNDVSVTDCTFAEQMLQAVGQTVWVANEAGLNSVIAASGSAPAYFFLFMQLMAEEAERMGFSAEQARLLVQQTALGSAQMVIDNPQLDLETLRAQVTSKGGTTAEAVRSFQEQGLANLVSEAMRAAVKRAEEMEQLF